MLFALDAERAHRLSVRAIRALGTASPALLRAVAGGAAARPSGARPEVFGLSFASRVGLAAGFDKDAELVEFLPALGFGFAEIGTVTPRPQPGNEGLRLFRDPGRGAIFNRMGFNSAGAAAVSARLARARERLPEEFRVGVNVGKNRDTPLAEAASDYARAIEPFDGLADYVVINVSSPNTPGLRSLQAQETLLPIVDAVAERLARGRGRRPPLLLKLAPELQGEALESLVRAAEAWGIGGWVLTNTLAGRHGDLEGGWSGRPLADAARASLARARAVTRLPIVSVGGILDAEEAAARRALGADLVQLYTGWVFSGPAFPGEVARHPSMT
jgi:dihydroorotate dehydrogenase